MTSVRQLTAYEKNQLQKHGFDASDVDVLEKLGEMPVEYFTSKVNFCDHEFIVDKNTLIPRVETEQLVEIIKKDIADSRDKHISFVEVGTGCGAIGLSLAYYLENKPLSYHSILTDISPKALKIAKANYVNLFPNYTFEGQVEFFEEDLLGDFPPERLLDYLIANLPYIPSERIPKLDSSVKNFEPSLALDGGEDGFDLIKKLIDQAELLLKPGGKLFLEVDDAHTADFFKNYKTKWKITHIKDQFKKNRFVVMEIIS